MTVYLEITESKYKSSGFRDNTRSYVPVEVEDLSKNNLEASLKKYCRDNDIIFGIIYNPGMVGTCPYNTYYFSNAVVVPHRFNNNEYEYWTINYSPVDDWTTINTMAFHSKVLEKIEDERGIHFTYYK